MKAQEKKVNQLKAQFRELGDKILDDAGKADKEIGKKMQLVAANIEKLEPGWQAKMDKRRAARRGQ